MHTTYMKKGGLAAAALAIVALAAWRAPEAQRQRRAGVVPPVTAAPTTSAAPVSSYAPVVERVMPAVVTIRVEKRASAVPTDSQIPEEFRRFFGPGLGQGVPRQPRGGMERGLGSGVIVSQDGFILTNNHVVDGANEVQVELPDRRTFTAKVVGTDGASDLAVVKIAAKDLPTLALGDSDAVKVGDVVLAIGNPLGVGETVTSGIISAKGPDDRARRRQLSGLPADRRAHQPWQFRRRAREYERAADRHQLADPHAGRRQHRAGLRDSVEHGQERDGSADRERRGAPREAGRHGAGPQRRHGVEPRTAVGAGCARQQRRRGIARRPRRASSRVT